MTTFADAVATVADITAEEIAKSQALISVLISMNKLSPQPASDLLIKFTQGLIDAGTSPEMAASITQVVQDQTVFA
jgi:phenylpyruvate tautomerase PptA (4-oxalocrotonate tautomerase family)